MTEDLLKLAAKVEAAEGPDREIDAEIVVALDQRPEWLAKSAGHLWVDRSGTYTVVRFCDQRTRQSSGNPSVDEVPRYTASLDAAMSLVPEGWDHIEVYQPDHQTLGWTVHIKPNANVPLGCWTGFARSYPLALVSAALRARAAALQGQG